MPDPPNHPPETWEPARRAAERLLRPLERYLHVEAASGIALLVMTAIAIGWANSSWSASYVALWHTPITFGVGSFVFRESLHFWINDVLMTIFFFVVGLEIRREIHCGELAELRRAALPIAAAIGGMIAPALLFALLVPTPDARHGWGVPMATDIAFAVGVLALLGPRVPAALRVLLLALAIIDDIGAILVIAIFYSAGIAWSGLLVAVGGVVVLYAFQLLGIRRSIVYVLPASVVWLGMYRAGIHPTIAGVIVGLATPVRPWFGKAGFVHAAADALAEFREKTEQRETDLERLLDPLRRLKEAQREALAPVVRVQAQLHPWVAFAIMPLFALANAGVDLRAFDPSDPPSLGIAVGAAVGLVVGKPLGILVASFVTVRLGLCVVPRGTTWLGVLLVGAVAGIGFTMAIFIAGLAFGSSPGLLGAAKLGVLGGSVVAGVFGLALGRSVLRREGAKGSAVSLDDAESSTEL